MTEPSLAGKMKRKPGAKAVIINAPTGYEAEMFVGFKRAASTLTGTFDWIQLFVRNEAELKTASPKAARALSPAGVLWICFPKGSSKVQTDLTRDKGWDSVEELGLKWITLISFDETWSAFALRPYHAGEARTGSRRKG